MGTKLGRSFLVYNLVALLTLLPIHVLIGLRGVLKDVHNGEGDPKKFDGWYYYYYQ